jgi:molecular chaperone HtpG
MPSSHSPVSNLRRRATAGGAKDYVGALKENQTAIYYLAGDDVARLENSPHLEGFRARGVEVLYLPDPVDNFWATSAPSFEGKPFKSVTQGATDLAAIPRLDAKEEATAATDIAITDFIAFTKATLGEAVADVRVSDRLTDSAVCLVAPEHGPDRQLERLLAGAGRITTAAKPILEVNPRHPLIVSPASARTRRVSRTTPRISCSTRRACSTASDRPTPAVFPTVSRAY